jgi:hypothetical protein
MKTTFRPIAYAIALSISVISPAVQAQYSGGMASTWNNPFSASMSRQMFSPMHDLMKELEAREAAARNGKLPSATQRAPAPNQAAQQHSSTALTSSESLRFRPVGNTGIGSLLAKSFTQKTDEQIQLVALFESIKSQYEKNVREKRLSNNLAVATAFLIEVCVTVFHDQPEQSDAATDALIRQIASTYLTNGATARMSNAEKHQLHDTFVYLAALAYGGYKVSKDSNDLPTMEQYQTIAGMLLKELLKIEPQRINMNDAGLAIR